MNRKYEYKSNQISIHISNSSTYFRYTNDIFHLIISLCFTTKRFNNQVGKSHLNVIIFPNNLLYIIKLYSSFIQLPIIRLYTVFPKKGHKNFSRYLCSYKSNPKGKIQLSNGQIIKTRIFHKDEQHAR